MISVPLSSIGTSKKISLVDDEFLYEKEEVIELLDDIYHLAGEIELYAIDMGEGVKNGKFDFLFSSEDKEAMINNMIYTYNVLREVKETILKDE